ncbi:hypothetical protein V501_02015 [Pseudogymnoascus sp. VKM F-4519 (FW-2642)]|nr:hypothetical protein V501_02015 [Pseudogymnoascus sp. VKM F-4519 (FW-2642)]
MEQTYTALNDFNYKAKQVDVDCTSNVVSEAVEIEWIDALEYLDLPAPLGVPNQVQSSQPPVRLRILATDSPNLNNQTLRLAHAVVPVPAEVLGHVAASLQDFEALWQNDAGSTTLLNGPRRFLMQTPNDGDLFYSMIVQTNAPREENSTENSPQRTNQPFNAILISSNPTVNMPKIAQSFSLPSLWSTTDLPIVILPLEFLLRHIRQVSETLVKLTTEVSCIEDIVIDGSKSPAHPEQLVSSINHTFKGLINRLHICNREIVKLRRRWHFQMTLARTIVELIEIHDPRIAAAQRNEINIVGDLHLREGSSVHFVNDTNDHRNNITDSREYRQLLSVASLQHKLSQSLEYDLDVLPTRISNQFNAIFNLMAQSDTQASLSIAISSRKDNEYMQHIADATLRDSSSMKTIAILTMAFLPGTFICSFFSMTMFNWNSQPGEPLVSPYIWIYFVAMVPLTLLVITIWWWKTKESRQEQEEDRRKRRLARVGTQDLRIHTHLTRTEACVCQQTDYARLCVV